MAGFALVAGAVVLAWSIVLQPVIERAPPELAARLAPNSPLVLRRAAEQELLAGRSDNALFLAREALSRAPFDPRALRVVGLSLARGGDEAAANEVLTLAGNWSLRDDPAHAWLMEYRLKRGDYSSSFAHADTLVRRRADLIPQLFSFFTIAAAEDPRSIPALVERMEARPPWRQAFLDSLVHSAGDQGRVALLRLAVALRDSRAPLTAVELGGIYGPWVAEGRLPAVRFLRQHLRRQGPAPLLENGGFDDPSSPAPFNWEIAFGPGFAAEIVAGEGKGGPALRVDHSGRSTGPMIRQLMMLDPGPYILSGRSTLEPAQDRARLTWTLTCHESREVLARGPVPPPQGAPRMETPFTVPAAGCSAQTLSLVDVDDDNRPFLALLDDIAVRPAGG